MSPVVVLAVVVGFWAVPVLAEVNRTLVNGVLLLLLVGIVLGNSARWTPTLAALGGAFGSAPAEKAKTPTPVGAPIKL